MKKLVIKKINLMKLFNGVTALSVIPAVLVSVMGIMGVISSLDQPSSISVILYYLLIILFIPVVNGLFAVIAGLSYNKLSPKLGQFEIEVEEKEA